MSTLLKVAMESHKSGDISKLKPVVLKLDNHLKNTNAKLAKLRHQIRIEANPKTRERLLKKSHSMVWEQQTIRRILDESKRDLLKLMANAEAKKAEKQLKQVPTRNNKLFDLLTNNDLDTEKVITEDEIPWKIPQSDIIDITNDDDSKSPTVETVKQKIVVGKPRVVTETENSTKKQRTSEELQPIDEIVINSQEEALRYITALQDYALMNDNFRATGLLVEAEKSLKNPAKTSDFEV